MGVGVERQFGGEEAVDEDQSVQRREEVPFGARLSVGSVPKRHRLTYFEKVVRG